MAYSNIYNKQKNKTLKQQNYRYFELIFIVYKRLQFSSQAPTCKTYTQIWPCSERFTAMTTLYYEPERFDSVDEFTIHSPPT
jgi:hypothetical protein